MFSGLSRKNSRGRMGIFGGYRADRLIAEVRESGDPTSAKAKTALTRLQGLGQNAIKPIVDALSTSDKRETIAFVEALTPLIDNKSFPLLAKALAEENPRAVAGVAWALASSRNYSPSLLLELLQAPGDFEAGGSRRHRGAEEPLQPARAPELRLPCRTRTRRPPCSASQASWWTRTRVDELVARVDGKDTIARTHIISLLARFDTPKVRAALQRTLKDPEQAGSASAALRAIANGSGQVDPGAGRAAAARPRLDVQNPAIELLCRSKHPGHGPPPRGSAEGRVGGRAPRRGRGAERRRRRQLDQVPASKAIRDADWWVRSRAADALGKIGGPQRHHRGARARLRQGRGGAPHRDRDPEPDQATSARSRYLIEATRDKDWWVSERAVDALGDMGNKKAVPRLIEMLTTNPKSVPTVVRALGKIGDAAATEGVLQALDRSETDIRDRRHVGARPPRRRPAPSTQCAQRSCRSATLTDQSLAGAAQRALYRARHALRRRLRSSGGAGHADAGGRGRARRPAAHDADRDPPTFPRS